MTKTQTLNKLVKVVLEFEGKKKPIDAGNAREFLACLNKAKNKNPDVVGLLLDYLGIRL